ncbi:hypothetical protein D3C76_1788630 [compost metagenome]
MEDHPVPGQSRQKRLFLRLPVPEGNGGVGVLSGLHRIGGDGKGAYAGFAAAGAGDKLL